MKKTLHKKKLQLSKQTVRQLSPKNLGDVNAAINGTTFTCTCGTCPTAFSCSCKQSVCNSCYNSDCCLMEP